MRAPAIRVYDKTAKMLSLFNSEGKAPRTKVSTLSCR